jgi:hypothetical protein
MRRRATRQRNGEVAHAASVPVGDVSFFRCVAILGVFSILLFASRLAVAEPAAMAEPAEFPAPVAIRVESPLIPSDSLSILSLLEIPPNLRSDAEIADESIAAAVERGNSPELEPRNPFRKRKTDLFRAERPLEIGDQEMLLRLRLRAKQREAMSVELHF